LFTRWVPRGDRSTRPHAIASARIRRFCQLPTAGNRLNGDDAPALDGLVSGNPGLKYYPLTDPYNQQGVVWVKGALEPEGQFAIAVAKLNKIPKPFIDETLERNSRLFETLEGHRLPAVIDGLLRRYGYGDVANRLETGALVEVSEPDPTPLLDRQS
jgi:hypothetical protein